MTLRWDCITVQYGGTKALAEASGTISSGLTVLVGPNGSGKTTLMRALTGLVRVQSGLISIDGVAIEGLQPNWRRRQGLLHVAQSSSSPPGVQVSAFLALAYATGDNWGAMRQRLREYRLPAALIDNLDPHASLASIPLAQRRLLELATSAAPDGKAVLLDEPLANLGSDGIALAGDFLVELSSRLPVLAVEHRPEFLRWAAQRGGAGLFIAAGRLSECAVPLEELLKTRCIQELYGTVL